MATILLDKSAFQGLSLAEVQSSRTRDKILGTDVLLLELLGDVRYGNNLAATLSWKLQITDLFINIPFQIICRQELLGFRVPMKLQPVLEGYVVSTSTDKKGVVISASEGDEALSRWARGEFDEQDRYYAKSWTECWQKLDLKAFERDVRERLPRRQQHRNIEDLIASVDADLSNHSSRDRLLCLMLTFLRLGDDWNSAILHRWSHERLSLIEDAPYTAFCARILLTAILAIGGEIIGARRTNILDAMYLFYLPFCEIFGSGDKVHKKLFPFVSLPGQTLLTTSQLKTRFMERKPGIRLDLVPTDGPNQC